MFAAFSLLEGRDTAFPSPQTPHPQGASRDSSKPLGSSIKLLRLRSRGECLWHSFRSLAAFARPPLILATFVASALLAWFCSQSSFACGLRARRQPPRTRALNVPRRASTNIGNRAKKNAGTAAKHSQLSLLFSVFDQQWGVKLLLGVRTFSE